MTALLAGIDWSTKALHAALIPLDEDHGDPSCPPVVFRYEELPKLGADPVARIREAQAAVQVVTRSYLPTLDDRHDVVSVWVEEAWGNHRNTDRALLPIYGAIVSGIRDRQTVAGISAREWRKELGLDLRLTKEGAVREAQDWLWQQGPRRSYRLDEHQAEALLVALAGRQIMARHAGVAA